MFITKEYKIKKPNINKKKIILNYNNITKVRLNKNKIINKIIFNSKNNQRIYKFKKQKIYTKTEYKNIFF